ncbi:MAG: winged helix-turn-helix domain-containing protein [Planctomycetes bacterium]|nr:winged helix-turn-helix domain-containing protein [Planctomycetota bacterium]
MAQGKSAKSSKTTKRLVKRGTPAASDDKPAAMKKTPTSSTPATFSGIVIGDAAGKVWGLLSTDGGQSIAAIKKSVDAPPDVVLAAIGWLAREDKLDFETSGRTVKISLR